MNSLARLADQIVQHFNLSELQDLCFDLSINYENLAGSTLNDKSRELLRYCERHQLLDQLLVQLREQRPDVDWPKITPQSGGLGADERPPARSRSRWALLLIPLVLLGGFVVWQLWPTSGSLPAEQPSSTPLADAPGASRPASGTDAQPTAPAAGQSVEREATKPAVTELDPAVQSTATPFLNLLTEQTLVASAGQTQNPNLVSDPDGGLHLLWWDNTLRNGAAGDLFYRYRSPDGEWGEVERLTDDSLEYLSQYDSRLRLRPDGAVCAFYVDGREGLLQRCWENGGWTAAARLRSEVIRTPDIQFDDQGQPRLVYWKPSDGIWFENTLLANGLTGGTDPALAIDREGGFHAVWVSRYSFPYQLMHRYSSDHGATWSDPEILTDEAAPADAPFALRSDEAGGVNLVWKGYGGGHFSRSWTTEGGWSPAVTLPGKAENNCTDVDLQQSRSGNLYFVWQGGGGVYITSRPSGENRVWTEPIRVSSRICRGYGPRLALVTEHQLFLVYSDQTDAQVDLYSAELDIP